MNVADSLADIFCSILLFINALNPKSKYYFIPFYVLLRYKALCSIYASNNSYKCMDFPAMTKISTEKIFFKVVANWHWLQPPCISRIDYNKFLMDPFLIPS